MDICSVLNRLSIRVLQLIGDPPPAEQSAKVSVSGGVGRFELDRATVSVLRLAAEFATNLHRDTQLIECHSAPRRQFSCTAREFLCLSVPVRKVRYWELLSKHVTQ